MKKRSTLYRLATTSLVVMTAVALTGCGGAATVEDLVKVYGKTTSYTVEIKAPGSPVVKQSIKLKDGKIQKLRMSTPMGFTLMDMENKCTYASMGGNIMKMPLQQDDGDDSIGTMSPVDFKGEGSKVVRSEKIGEVDCLVIESTKDGDSGTVWIGKADGLVRQVLNGKDKVEFKYSDINAVKASEFELPKDANVKDMTKMMGAFQNMMGGN